MRKYEVATSPLWGIARAFGVKTKEPSVGGASRARSRTPAPEAPAAPTTGPALDRDLARDFALARAIGGLYRPGERESVGAVARDLQQIIEEEASARVASATASEEDG
jgi:hypothetical protein